MASLAHDLSIGEWMRRYGRERAQRQQAEEATRRLAEQLPSLFVAAAPRILSERELAEVVSGVLAYAELLLSGFASPGAREPEVVAA